MFVKSTVVWVAAVAAMSSAFPVLAVDQGDIDNLQGQVDGIHGDVNEVHKHLENDESELQTIHDYLESDESEYRQYNDDHTAKESQLESRINFNQSEIERNFKEHEQVNNGVNDAKNSASNAVATANDAKGEASQANTNATNAQGMAQTAQTTANDAKGEASQANTNATNAQGMAQTAQTTANDAKGEASQANTNATNAQGMAQTAQTTANDAKGEAGKAVTQATKAQGTADTAQRNTQVNAADIQTLRNNTSNMDERIHQGSDRAVQQANAYTDSRFKENDKRIDNVRREARSGIADVAAMANIPQIPNKDFTLGVGAGHYMDRTAVAVGAVIRSSEATAWKISAASDGNTPTYGLGFATGF